MPELVFKAVGLVVGFAIDFVVFEVGSLAAYRLWHYSDREQRKRDRLHRFRMIQTKSAG